MTIQYFCQNEQRKRQILTRGGLTVTFAPQDVDGIQLRSSVAQNFTFENWSDMQFAFSPEGSYLWSGPDAFDTASNTFDAIPGVDALVVSGIGTAQVNTGQGSVTIYLDLHDPNTNQWVNVWERTITEADSPVPLGGLNGIDYLEVMALPLDGTEAPQRQLQVRFLLPLAVRTPIPDEPAPVLPRRLSPDNIRIEGGETVRNINVEAVSILRDDSVDGIDSHVLLVDLDKYGDYSIYTLRVVSGPGDLESPVWMDPILSAVDFSFKVDCPSEFDCKAVTTCPTEVSEQPEIDYLAKDYASFRELMLNRMSTIMPNWQERSASDIGVAVVETLAYAADHVSYYQDAVGTEAYLGTARKRVSMRRHARLLDYFMHDGCNARTWVFFDAATNGTLPAHTPLFTGDSLPRNLEVTTVNGRSCIANLSGEIQVFETMHSIELNTAFNQIDFYTWGDDRCCLPEGATRASLNNEGDALAGLEPGALLLFEEVLGVNGTEADRDRRHRHVVRLTRVEFVDDPLYLEAGTTIPLRVVNIEWAPEDALPFPLCLWRLDGRPVSVARGNVVLADHGRTVCDENLIPAAAPAEGRYRPRLQRTEVTFREPFDADRAWSQPAALAAQQNARAALAQVELDDEGNPWFVRRGLLNSDRFAPDFVVETEDDGRAYLRFGDNVLGRRPSSGTTFLATYRVGNGTVGNVGAESIRQYKLPPGVSVGLNAVRNPLPAQGGTDAETIEEARLYAPEALYTQRRAVTPEDYAAVTEQHPDVQKAVTTQRWTGSWHTMFIAVDRKGGRPVDAEFETELRDHIEPFRMMSHDLEIEPPRPVPLDIVLNVTVGPDYLRSTIKAELLELFSNETLSNGRLGFFHPDKLSFEQPIYLSPIITAAMAVTGVTAVDAERFKRLREPARGELENGVIPINRLEIARVDNDPNAPQNGQIAFIMQGGL